MSRRTATCASEVSQDVQSSRSVPETTTSCEHDLRVYWMSPEDQELPRQSHVVPCSAKTSQMATHTPSTATLELVKHRQSMTHDQSSSPHTTLAYLREEFEMVHPPGRGAKKINSSQRS